MKPRKFYKVILTVLIITASIFAIAIIGTSAEGDTPVIRTKNIAISDKIQALYAVEITDTITENNTTLSVYDVFPDETTAPIWSGYGTKELIKSFDKEYIVFRTNRIPLYNMAQEFYIQAVSGDKKSEVMTYSVAEYLFERLYKNDFISKTEADGDDYSRRLMYEDLVSIGASSHSVFSGKDSVTEKSIIDRIYIHISGGTINGKNELVVDKDSTLTIEVPGASTPSFEITCYSDGIKTTQTKETSEIIAGAHTLLKLTDPYKYYFDGDTLPSEFVLYSTGASLGVSEGKFKMVTENVFSGFRVKNPLCEAKDGATKYIVECDMSISYNDQENHKNGTSDHYNLFFGRHATALSIPLYARNGEAYFWNGTTGTKVLAAEFGKEFTLRAEVTPNAESGAVIELFINGESVYTKTTTFTYGISTLNASNDYAFVVESNTGLNSVMTIDNLKFIKE